MSFTVIGAPLSPFVRKVHVTLQIKAIEFDIDPISPFNLPTGYEKINPLKRIPVLLHDGHYIRDSAIICRYLEDLHPAPVLIPEQPLLKAQVAWLEKLADYELGPAISATAFRHRVVYRAMGKPYDEQEIAALIAEKTPPLYDILDTEIGDHSFLVGEQLSLADIAVASQFINASLGNEQVDPARWPNLARYLNEHFASEVFAPVIERAKGVVAKMLANAP